MAKTKLHLDADIAYRALQKALAQRGHDVTRTPNDWIPFTASDETQLLRATARGRCIVTFNITDFTLLSQMYPNHVGIILATQNKWTLSPLIFALDKLLSETQAEDLKGQIRWLNDWR